MRTALRRSFAAGIVALSCGAGACAPTANDMFPIGGAWHKYRHQSLIVEAGRRPSDLYREWKGARVLVASDVEFDQYYSEPDCLLWETKSRDHVVFAACGEHEPLVVATDDYHRWTMDPRGLVVEDQPRANEQGVPVRPTVMFPLDAIAAASARRPAFNAGWFSASARLDDGLQPVEADVPIDVTAINVIRRTPLIEAAGARILSPADRDRLVKALIEHGANVNAADNMGITALMVAADNGHVEVIRRLIAGGAAIDAKTTDGRTALMEAAGSLDNQVASVTVLLEAGADKTIRDKYGRSAFTAIRTNTDPQLKVLLEVK